MEGFSNNDIFKLSPSNKTHKNITVIGCGRWGTFIAWYLDKIGHNVSLYGRATSKNMQQLLETRKNEYLSVGDSLKLTTTLDGIEKCDYIVISIAAQNLCDLTKQLSALGIKNKTIVLCMKGLEIKTGRRLSQIVKDGLCPSNSVVVWLGPGHVQEFCRGIPNCMVIDSDSDSAKREIIDNFSSDLIRFYYGTDLIGNEVGAAAKNVVGIAAGMLEGLDLSSLKGALMSRGTNEIARLICAMGGNAATVYGLCHLGDYEATLFSSHSQNLTFGKNIVQNKSFDKLAEGYYTVKALCDLGKMHNVELPICNAVEQVLYGGAEPKTVLKNLFSRTLTSEFTI